MFSNKEISHADIYAGRYGLQVRSLSLLIGSNLKIWAEEMVWIPTSLLPLLVGVSTDSLQ